jgi:hypothetical protein
MGLGYEMEIGQTFVPVLSIDRCFGF